MFRLTSLGLETGQGVLGRLEICYNGHWGSMCDDHINDATAAIACRELGYYNSTTSEEVHSVIQVNS